MIHQKTEAVAPIVRIDLNPNIPRASNCGSTIGNYSVTVCCPFCSEEHGHGMTRGDALLGVALHRGADSCWPFTELGRKGLRKKRRAELEEGLALREQCGGGYFITPTISLYAEFKDGRLVGLRLGEMRKMRVRTAARGARHD